jgi:hypothetical protein
MRKFTGTLILDDNNDYILSGDNLSTYLHHIYMSNVSNYIELEIKDVQKAKGDLYLQRDMFGVYDYFVGQFALGLWLHNHTGEEMTITIKYAKEESES